MKLYIAVAALTSLAVVVADRRCDNSEDCRKNECCVAKEFGFYIRGRCKRMTEAGNYCSMEGETIKGIHGETTYFKACPCKEGLYCHERKTHWGPIRSRECRKYKTTTEESVETTTELEKTTVEPQEPTTEPEEQPSTESEEQPSTESEEMTTEPEKPDTTEPAETTTEREEQPVTEPAETTTVSEESGGDDNDGSATVADVDTGKRY